MVHTHKCGKICAMVFTLLAVLLGILAVALPQDKIYFVILISRFFEVMIPVLAVGALLKYIFNCWEK